MARKGENIFKRKDGRWEGRYIKSRENGKAVYGYVFGKSYSEAKKKKTEAMKGLSSSARPTSHRILRTKAVSQVSEQPVSGQPLMRDVAYQWLEELKTTRRRSTTTKYEGQLRNHIIPEFGDKHIDDISNKDLISFSQKLLRKPGRSGRVLSPRTVADIIARMKSIRKFSLLHGYEVRYASLFLITFLGVITGVGGGVIRDVLAERTPSIFVWCADCYDCRSTDSNFDSYSCRKLSLGSAENK